MHSIAVLVPAYNAAGSIRRLADSLKRQSVPFDQVVVVDDGSSDDTAILAKTLMPEADVIMLNENSGKYHALMAGLDAVKCDYTVQIDADDELSDGFVEFVNGILDTYGYDYVYMPMTRLEPNGGMHRVDESTPLDRKEASDCLDVFFSYRNPWYVTGKAVRTGIWRDAMDPSIPKKIILDDVFISLKLHVLSKSYCRPETEESYLYHFGVGYWSGSRDSITLDWFMKNLEMRLLEYRNNLDFLERHGFGRKYAAALYERCDFRTLLCMLPLLPVKDLLHALAALDSKCVLFPKQ